VPKYRVDVCRTGYGFNTIEVEASCEDEAMMRALGTAGNHFYSEKDSDYTVESVERIKE
jgi:hypothetical protein